MIIRALWSRGTSFATGLARELRAGGLPATADAERAMIGVVVQGRDVTIDLRPDRYHRHLDALAEEFETIGGDPREHAWTSWCRRVQHALTHGAPPDLRRLSFAESPEGEVFLVADAVGDEPPESQYVWSADPGH